MIERFPGTDGEEDRSREAGYDTRGEELIEFLSQLYESTVTPPAMRDSGSGVFLSPQVPDRVQTRRRHSPG